MECWKGHFSAHLNTNSQHEPKTLNDILDSPNNVIEEPSISKDEIREAVISIKRGKGAGIVETTVDVIKTASEPMIEMLEKISLKVWDEEQSPKDWSCMLVAPIYKKGDKRDLANHSVIALFSISGKIFHKVLLNRMRDQIKEKAKESQYGFRPGQGTVDAIFLIRQIIEKDKERKIALHFSFIDFKAAFGIIRRIALWKMLRSIGNKTVNIIKA